MNNLSIISALNEAEIYRKTIDQQRSKHLPQLDLVASYGVSDLVYAAKRQQFTQARDRRATECAFV